MMRDQKLTAFRALHERHGAFVIPNPWNAGTARILAALGFEALATTSAGYAFAVGRRDSAAGLTRDEILENARDIVEATHLPVSADLEDGFGASPEMCADTIRLASDIGLVGDPSRMRRAIKTNQSMNSTLPSSASRRPQRSLTSASFC